jgi:hypothetical protein
MRPTILLTVLLALGCQLSPTVTTRPSDEGGSRYGDCRRASRDYCRDVVEASDDERDKCVSQRVFECVSGPRP